MTVEKLNPQQVEKLLQQGARLIDIRDLDEYAREHIPQAQCVPLASLTKGLAAGDRETLIFHCQSGTRTANNVEKLLGAAWPAKVCLMDGGLNAWRRCGLEVLKDKRQPLPIMRQVQIAAGVLILCGVILGYSLAPGWFILSGLVGAGLLFAGISGYCGMANLLKIMPWNRG